LEFKHIKFIENKYKTDKDNDLLRLFSKQERDKVFKFHKSMGDSYNETDLVSLKSFAKGLGIDSFFVKDESQRGNLKAFKLLGGSFAVANIICDLLKVDIVDVDFNYLKSGEVKDKLGDLTFAAASDGNHGRSVAFAANKFNQKAIIYMPKGTAQDRIKNIEALGSKVVVTEGNYDFCGREVSLLADEKGWIIVPDTASEGDPEIARKVMQGYLTMATEIISKLKDAPTHVFLQAGVGSMAATMLSAFKLGYKDNQPKFYILEPFKANCFYRSGEKGEAVTVDGDMDSIMAGLSCGVPSPDGWSLIKDYADGFISCSDALTANGMRILANPNGADKKIIAGESGAVGTGVVDYIIKNDEKVKSSLGLDSKSRVLVISTEGDTDTKNYQDVVWYGKHSYYNE
jgi:diaminopropionate ammonia-lyase